VVVRVAVVGAGVVGLAASATLLANCRDRWLGVSSGVWQARLS
jgi:cation diffusion facilitator CzcD-associated flavoprotein CzcO